MDLCHKACESGPGDANGHVILLLSGRQRPDVTYNLEFKLPSISEHLHLPINPAALDINHNAAAHSKIHQAPLRPKKSKVPWTEEEDAKLLQMWNEGRSWEYIAAALPGRPGHTEGSEY